MQSYTTLTSMATAALIAAATTVPHNATAATYEVTLESIVSPQSPNKWLNLPNQFNSPNTTVQARFFINDETETTFGNFNCEPNTPKSCGAYGYKVTDLQVFINGESQSGWESGTSPSSFFNGTIDLRERGFFTTHGLPGIGNAWLPLLHKDFPEATFNFGQMYISLGGVNFMSFAFSATDMNDYKANGWAWATATQVPSVPEPTTTALVVAGLLTLCTRRSKTPRCYE